jgi:hypothetical protein
VVFEQPRAPELRSTKMPRVPALSRQPLRPDCSVNLWKGLTGGGSWAVPVLDGEQPSLPWTYRAGPLSQERSFFASWAGRYRPPSAAR